MCGRHGRIIDNDECTYTPDMLKLWQKIADKKAHIHHEKGQEVQLSARPPRPRHFSLLLEMTDGKINGNCSAFNPD